MKSITSTKGSDNIFKYMVTVGMLLIGIGVIYPLEKKNDFELKQNNLIFELKTDSLQNTFLITKLEETSKKDKEDLAKAQIIKKKIKNLKPSKKRTELEKQLNELLKSKELELALYTKLFQERQTNSIKLEFKGKEVELLRRQSDNFGKYYKFCFWIGLPLAIFGFIFWLIQTYYDCSKSKNN